VNQKQLTAFTRQLATLLDAGLPVVRSLDILVGQLKTGPAEGGFGVRQRGRRRRRVAVRGARAASSVFDKLYVNMIRAGEAGGVLI